MIMNPRFRKVLRRTQRVRAALMPSRQEEIMEKYGYEKGKEKDGEKTAEEKGGCPKCGSPLSGSPPVCPKCGSEPFEEKPGEKG